MYRFVYALLTVFLFFSCKPEIENLTWDSNMLVPLAHTKLSLQDLVKDSLIKEGDNKRLELVYQEELTRLKPLDTLVELQVEPFKGSYSLTSLKLDDITFQENLTIGQLITEAGLDGYTIPFINVTLRDGALIPRYALELLSGIDGTENTLDFSTYFTSGVLSSGLLDISISNSSIVSISSFDLVVKDIASNQELFTYTVTGPIDKGLPLNIKNIDLAQDLNGKTIGSQLSFQIKNLDIGASTTDLSNPAVLDYGGRLNIGFKLHGIQVQEAVAVLPEQDVIELIDEVPLDGNIDAELTFGTIKKGAIKITVISTLPTDLYFDYEIPGSSDPTGDPFKIVNQKINAGSTLTPTVFAKTFDFSEYDLDFTGVPQNLVSKPKYQHLSGGLTNTIIHELTGRIQNSGVPIVLSLDDSISVELEIIDLEAEYVEGYIGQETISTGLEQFMVDFNQELPLDNSTFEKVEFNLRVENFIGLPAEATIKDLTFTNSTSGASKSISNLPAQFDLPSASKTGSNISPGIGAFEITNATDIYNIKPDQIEYELDLSTNPLGNTPLNSNFASINSELIIKSDLRIPLSINANNFVLEDTVDLGNDLQDIGDVKEGIINLIVNNGFPFVADIELNFLDNEMRHIDRLKNTEVVASGKTNSEGVVTQATKTVIPFYFSEQRLERLSEQSKYLVVKITINSEDPNTFSQIYSNYVFDIHLTGDFELQVNTEL